MIKRKRTGKQLQKSGDFKFTISSHCRISENERRHFVKIFWKKMESNSIFFYFCTYDSKSNHRLIKRTNKTL